MVMYKNLFIWIYKEINEFTQKTRFCHFERSEKSHNYYKNKRFLVASLLEMTVIEPF